MRYGYAVLKPDEDAVTSPGLFFDQIIDVDRFYIDRSELRYNRGALFRSLLDGDEVILQSKNDCGLTEQEFSAKIRLSHNF